MKMSSAAGSGRLIVVSGPSGAGKGTVCKRLIERRPEIALSISWTTRRQRPGDIPGQSYHFKSVEEFDALAAIGGFLEHAGMYGSQYGTPRPFIDENLAAGRDVILEIESKGARQVILGGEYEVVSVFLLPPSMEELKNRLKGRSSESEESFSRRFQSAYSEIDFAKEYDYIIVNSDVDQAVRALESVIDGSRFRTERAGELLKKLKEEPTP
ncbi:MAG: guanylate kinase [Christensenellaceae bacterium]|jgi:guanylate kinase|nr:guanylate kinase [Christensenellaceae bacterium]